MDLIIGKQFVEFFDYFFVVEFYSGCILFHDYFIF